MLSKEEHSLIVGRLENTLSAAEEQLFLEKYAANEAFRKASVANTGLLAAIEALHKKAIKDTFTSWLSLTEEHDQMAMPLKSPGNQLHWYLFATAASASLLLVFILLWQPDTNTADELFADNFQPLENILSVREVADQHLSLGMALYESSDYENAVITLRKSKNQDAVVSLYLGISYLALGNTPEARKVFEANINTADKVLSEYFAWYLALTYLKEKNYAETMHKLQRLIDDQSEDFSKNALKLMKAIEARP